MAETAETLIERIEAALARIEVARAADAGAAARLRDLETVVETSIADLNDLMAAR